MEFVLHPWHLMILAVSACINRDQGEIIEYLLVENQMLREKLGKGRILLNDGQRHRLAIRGKILGWKVLSGLATIATPCSSLQCPSEASLCRGLHLYAILSTKFAL